VLRLVLKDGMKLALIGIAIGLAAASALTRLLASFLFGVTPTDALTFVSVSLLLLVVALLACFIPARRATKVDPLVACNTSELSERQTARKQLVPHGSET